MLLVHVIVARAARLEDCHTNPADMRLTSPASHVIAALRLLHRCHAFRTIFSCQVPFSASGVPRSHPMQYLYILHTYDRYDARGRRYGYVQSSWDRNMLNYLSLRLKYTDRGSHNLELGSSERPRGDVGSNFRRMT